MMGCYEEDGDGSVFATDADVVPEGYYREANPFRGNVTDKGGL